MLASYRVFTSGSRRSDARRFSDSARVVREPFLLGLRFRLRIVGSPWFVDFLPVVSRGVSRKSRRRCRCRPIHRLIDRSRAELYASNFRGIKENKGDETVTLVMRVHRGKSCLTLSASYSGIRQSLYLQNGKREREKYLCYLTLLFIFCELVFPLFRWSLHFSFFLFALWCTRNEKIEGTRDRGKLGTWITSLSIHYRTANFSDETRNNFNKSLRRGELARRAIRFASTYARPTFVRLLSSLRSPDGELSRDVSGGTRHRGFYSLSLNHCHGFSLLYIVIYR